MLLDPGLGEFEPGPGSMASDCMSVGTCGEWRELNGEFREHKMKAVVLRSGCNDWGPPARVLVDGKERLPAGTPSTVARLP